MASNHLFLVYDDECPACRNYAQIIRVRRAAGELVLINAREDVEQVHQVTEAGFDLDQGMALIIGQRIYYGADTMHMLALLGSRSGAFNSINYWVFRSPLRSRILYPILRAGRNLLLSLLSKTKIKNLSKGDNTEF